MNYKATYSDELYHHGILGQKWGIRRFRNKDGSLTNAGKKRYNSTPHRSFASVLFTKESKKTDEASENYKKLEKEVKELHSKMDLSKIREADGNFNKLGDELASDYKNYYKSLKGNKEFKDNVYRDLSENIGDIDDPDFFDWDLEDSITNVTRKMEPKGLKNKVSEFYKNGDAYFDECKKATAEIASKYKNVPVKSPFQMINGFSVTPKDIANKIFMDEESNAHWNSYMYKHFDDYWVNDVDERYDLTSDFSFEEYKKWKNGGGQ